jgi:hypothetical protein
MAIRSVNPGVWGDKEQYQRVCCDSVHRRGCGQGLSIVLLDIVQPAVPHVNYWREMHWKRGEDWTD